MAVQPCMEWIPMKKNKIKKIINVIIFISCFLNFLFPSAINFSSFSVGSLSMKDLDKVSELFDGLFIFFGLHSTFLFAVAFLLPPRSFSGSVFWYSLSNYDSTIFKGSAHSYSLPMEKGYPTIFHSLFPHGNN